MSANRKWVEQTVIKEAMTESSNYFETPDLFFKKWNEIYDFKFDLSANEGNSKCPKYYTEAQDSLKQDWHQINGWLWLNPPYSPLKPWVQKAQQEADKGAKIVMLIPPILNTRYFAERLPSEIIYIVGRLPFLNYKKIPMKGNSHDSCLVVYDGKNQNTHVRWAFR